MHDTKKAIVVEDSSTIRSIVRGMLNDFGITEIKEFTCGADAAEYLETHEADVIISDWHMEPMSGIELLKHVREHARLKKTPFIMATSENSAESLMNAVNEDVTQFISKPFSKIHLKKCLDQAFQDV